MKKKVLPLLLITSLAANSTITAGATGWSTGSEILSNNPQTVISNTINEINNYRQSS